ncbi:MAG: division/cell wall cluster transcriptional repressor MraZ [Eubacterium sp.]|nr:division/cell wall cluster transcriptional repressor MraZ [Eubacterium sp.]
MIGNYNHNIDAKGRVIIPAKLRDSLGRQFVMTIGFEECIYLYSLDEWDKLAEKLRALGNKKDLARNIKRLFQANACDSEFDSQGRTLIPQNFREELGLDREVVIVGNGEKAEIWNKETWNKTFSKPELSKENIKKLLEESDFDIDF